MFVCLFVCLLFVCLFACLLVCLFVYYLFVYLLVCLYVCLFIVYSQFHDSKDTVLPDKPPKGSIYFHDDKYPFFEFSPYFPHEVRINGIKWPTVSHYYLGQRFAGSKLEGKIQECGSAGEAMKVAYDPDNQDFVRTDWKEVKVVTCLTV